MKRIKKSAELIWIMGILIIALGVAICSKANLGVSMIAAPAFVLQEALVGSLPWISVGVTEYIIQGILLLLLCVLVRKFNWRFLLSFAVAVVYGYVLDLFLWLLGGVSLDSVAMRWVMLIVGDIVTAFGVACFFRTYMPLQVYELFVSENSKCFHIDISRVKLFFDLSLLFVSLVMALTLFGDVSEFDFSTIGYTSLHSIGLGTLVTTVINSPIIALMGRLIDKIFDTTPAFPRLKSSLET